MAVKTEIMTQKVSNSSYNAIETENKTNIINILEKELTEEKWTKVPITINGNVIRITYIDNSIKRGSITENKPEQNGKVIAEIVLKEQSADLYINGEAVTGEQSQTAGIGTVNMSYVNDFGKVVTGYPITGTWRLFYADLDSVYLIRNSIGNIGIINFSWFSTSTEVSDLGKNLNTKYSSWNLKSDGENINENIKATATLLDTTKWIDYKSDYATWAIGGPTLEMFIASYNATHTTQLDCKIETDTSMGYKVGKSVTGGTVTNFGASVTNLGSEEIDKAIYCYDSGPWYLSTLSFEDKRFMYYVNSDNNGTVTGHNAYWNRKRNKTCC